MTERARVLFRADASEEIGTGHVMRCLALAQACRAEAVDVRLATARPIGSLAARWNDAGAAVEQIGTEAGGARDAEATGALAREARAAWVVVDGYRFDLRFQRDLREASGARLLLVDDVGGAGAYDADVILNQNLHARAGLYFGAGRATLLLGLRYLLLREEFLQARNADRPRSASLQRVVVTFGGSDPGNFALRALRALDDAVRRPGVGRIEVTLVVGGSCPHRSEIERAAASTRGIAVDVRYNVEDMGTVLGSADIAVAAAGSTAWELAFLGVPSLLVAMADNQRGVAEELARCGAARHVGDADTASHDRLVDALVGLLTSPADRQRMAEAGRVLLDGRGAARVAQVILGIADRAWTS